MIVLSPDRYLDLRSPAWAPHELDGHVRFEGGLIVAQLPDPVEAYLNEHAPSLTVAEAQLLANQWKQRAR